MFLLRRSVTRAIASSPSTAFVAKTRSINTIAPAAFRVRQQTWAVPTFQRRFASDDAEKAAAEASETFAQTAAEAPVEENLTPAQVSAQAPSTDASATVGSDQLEQAIRQPKPWQRRAPDEQAVPNRTLYVGNLFYDVTAEQLQRVFSRFGEVEDVKIVYDNRGLNRGFGYVDFKDVEAAKVAVENLDSQVFEGRNLVVQFHKPKSHSKSHLGPDGSFTANPPSKTLFIGNMSYQMSDKDLNDLFRNIKNVMDVRVAIDRRTGNPRGFAHADFMDVASAVQAKEQLNDKVVYGRALRIDFSKSHRDNESDRSRSSRSDSGTMQ